MPGGVNSPVRAFTAVGNSPPFIARGSGAHLTDVDGRRYVAVSTGVAGTSGGLLVLTPELRPSLGNNLFVFALPESTRRFVARY